MSSFTQNETKYDGSRRTLDIAVETCTKQFGLY